VSLEYLGSIYAVSVTYKVNDGVNHTSIMSQSILIAKKYLSLTQGRMG
jgi:hypothetical protein